jgi:DNA-binding NtrC family response regulator
LSRDNLTELFSRSTSPLKFLECRAIRVLLVDSDECFRTGLAGNLRDDGHQVCEYTTAADVPPVSLLGTIAASVLEYSSASPEHLELADAIHKAFPAAAVLLVTSCSSNDAEMDTASRQFLHVQARPLDYAVLHDFIHRSAPRLK